MTQEQILEGNKLIAEFLGLATQLHMIESPFTGEYIDIEDLKFNNSWDWLMPIVHRCLSIAHEEMLNEWENSFADVFLAASIDIMYKEAVDFIKWYNQNKS